MKICESSFINLQNVGRFTIKNVGLNYVNKIRKERPADSLRVVVSFIFSSIVSYCIHQILKAERRSGQELFVKRNGVLKSPQ